MADPVFSLMKVAELKAYLKAKGQLSSGRKEELIRRAEATHELLKGNVILDRSRAFNTDAAHCPRNVSAAEAVFSLNDWIESGDVPAEQWPSVTEKELYNYMVYTSPTAIAGYGPKNARKQLKAKTFYEDSHVHTVRYNAVSADSTECYIKCCVIPSSASSDVKKFPDHEVWIQLSKLSGFISTAYCTCTAGIEGSCNHVAALLYALVDISQRKQEGLDTSTSQACKWNAPRKRKLSPKKAASLAAKPCTSGPPPQSGVDVTNFQKKLKLIAPQCGYFVMSTASEQVVHKTELLPSCPMPEFCFLDSVNIRSKTCEDSFAEFIKTQTLTEEERWLTEKLTRGQSTNELWFEAHKNRLTSSMFGRIAKKKLNTLPDAILREVCGYNTITFENVHTKWGKTHEAAARRKYVNLMKMHHPHINVTLSGLVVSQCEPYLAASPDGMVHCPHCVPSQGLLEIKCPSKYRHLTPEDAAKQTDFFCQLVEGKVSLKRTHDYYFQVLGQMAVCGKQWCDFVVWTMKGISVERISFDKKHWCELKEKLVNFYQFYVVPELFTQRVKRGLSL